MKEIKKKFVKDLTDNLGVKKKKSNRKTVSEKKGGRLTEQEGLGPFLWAE